MTARRSYDALWTAVDTYAFRQSHPASQSNTQELVNAQAASQAAGLPSYALSPAQGKFLALHCRTAKVTHALEVGTLGGYSAIWMASENPQLQLTTIEHNSRHVEVARANIEHAGLSDRVQVIHGAALAVLSRLSDEVRAGIRPRFGFVFIDADKVNNWRYFQLARDMVHPNSVICVDNIVRDGQLVDFYDPDPSVRGSREVVENAGRAPGVDSVVLQTVGEKGYDGWLWAVIS
ncbi:hypothetical protein EYZ11_005468 [Aspergillus tanneri]|uniref:O-methyltransferase n=1 Tax=Aspergillus tanneri TaxID=1220188 RepID=A0A4S3JI64_9EURO|nr:uncharacterized protein ATNIH1004_008276 [Aspergillus tanneri]KAA8644078.1 hypothetical protein ATNIH1004_008276 [Aspergillus tanneri]THC95073.1 hypothetical protein EYZ11_005468 [Aspergillus tanneri]